MTEWKSDGEVNAPLEAMLANLNSIMQAGGILTVCGGKDLRLNTEGFRRVGKLRAGKRLIIILEKV